MSQRKIQGTPDGSGAPALEILQEDGAPALRIRHEGSSGNAIEVVGPNGGTLWSVDRAGSNGGLSSLRAAVPVADRAFPSSSLASNGGGTLELSDGTTQGGTFRVRHTMLVTATGIRLVFSNFYNHNAVETDGPNDITVAAAVEAVGQIDPFPVTFNGQRQVTIKPGTSVVADPLGITFAKGTTFGTRTFVSVAGGLKFPRGGPQTVFANQEGHNYPGTATTGADLTPFGSASVPSVSNARGFSPSAILGTPVTQPAVVLGIIGDSIAAGTGDADPDNGYIRRALGQNYSYEMVAYPGETISSFMQTQDALSIRRKNLFALFPVTHYIVEMGVNSLGSGSWQANLLTLWQRLAATGAKVYQTTITPVTTSTDSWATLANQTPTANEATRLAMNAYIRSLPAPLSGYFEIADLAESARDSGKWRVDLGTPTTDGTHPGPNITPTLAGGITPSTFGSPAV